MDEWPTTQPSMKQLRCFTGMLGYGELAATACSPSIFPLSTV
jgi:hypothetical protein